MPLISTFVISLIYQLGDGDTLSPFDVDPILAQGMKQQQEWNYAGNIHSLYGYHNP